MYTIILYDHILMKLGSRQILFYIYIIYYNLIIMYESLIYIYIYIRHMFLIIYNEIYIEKLLSF